MLIGLAVLFRTRKNVLLVFHFSHVFLTNFRPKEAPTLRPNLRNFENQSDVSSQLEILNPTGRTYAGAVAGTRSSQLHFGGRWGQIVVMTFGRSLGPDRRNNIWAVAGARSS